MWNIFSFSPYIAGYGAAILTTLLIISYVWFPKDYKPKGNFAVISLFRFFKGLMFGIYFGFGIILVDTAVIWLLGQWVYSDWPYQLPAVLLGLVVGSEAIIGTFFVHPHKKDLIFGLVFIGVMVYLIQFYIPTPTDMSPRMTNVLYIMLSIAFIYAIIEFFSFILENSREPKKDNETKKPLWDFTKNFHNIFSRKFNIVIWIISVLEAMLIFAGSSILTI